MILFLDYDGVLHPDEVYLFGGQPQLKADGELFMWAPVLIEILRPYHDLEIVLSTSWVRLLGFSRARDYLPLELRTRVIGGTWHSAMGRSDGGRHRGDSNWFVAASRYEQITRYVSRARGRAEHWLAIDDDEAGWDDRAREHLVETVGDVGLSALKTQAELREKLLRLYSLGAPPSIS